MIIKFNNAEIKRIQAEAQRYLNKVANTIQVEAKAAAPVDTGTLQNNIEVFMGDDDHERLVGNKEPYYAIYVEMGHKTVNGGFVDPNPYLRSSMDKVIGEL